MSLTKRTLFSFTLYYIALIIVTIVIGMLLEAYTEIDPPSSIGIVIFLAAVVGAGGKLGEHLSQMPTSGALWGLSFKLMLTSFVVSGAMFAAIVGIIVSLDPSHATGFEFLFTLDPTTLALIAMIVGLVYLLVARVMLPIGIKSGLKKRTR
ncbi:MAG: ABZJ_00895 family protein [Pseudomonadota bacterium]